MFFLTESDITHKEMIYAFDKYVKNLTRSLYFLNYVIVCFKNTYNHRYAILYYFNYNKNITLWLTIRIWLYWKFANVTSWIIKWLATYNSNFFINLWIKNMKTCGHNITK